MVTHNVIIAVRCTSRSKEGVLGMMHERVSEEGGWVLVRSCFGL